MIFFWSKKIFSCDSTSLWSPFLCLKIALVLKYELDCCSFALSTIRSVSKHLWPLSCGGCKAYRGGSHQCLRRQSSFFVHNSPSSNLLWPSTSSRRQHLSPIVRWGQQHPTFMWASSCQAWSGPAWNERGRWSGHLGAATRASLLNHAQLCFQPFEQVCLWIHSDSWRLRHAVSKNLSITPTRRVLANANTSPEPMCHARCVCI